MSRRPIPSQYPISQSFYGTFSSQFSGSSVHGGTDFATPVGVPVIAPDDGVIVHSDWAWNLPGGPNDWASRWYLLKPNVGNTSGGGGIITILRNDAGSHWVFAHLSSNDEAPKGKRVRAGDIIGKTGNTGTSTAPHIHVELIPPNPKYTSYSWGRIDSVPFMTDPYLPNKYTSWTGAATTGKGSAATAPAVLTKPYKVVTDWTQNHSGKRNVKLQGVVIHWWDDPAKRPSLNGVVSWFKNPASQVSAHYVVENGTVVQMVRDDHVAWHAGSKHWNERTIGIECNPRMTQGDLETVAQLVADLERKHGPLLIYKHSDVNPGTQCPGTYAAKIGWLVDRVNTLKTAAAPTVSTTSSAAGGWSIEELLNMSQADFDRDRKKAGTPAWYLANGRDHAAAARKAADLSAHRVSVVDRLVRGLPASIFGTKIRRPDKSEVTLGTAVAYEKQNWTADRGNQSEILTELKKINTRLDALEGK